MNNEIISTQKQVINTKLGTPKFIFGICLFVYNLISAIIIFYVLFETYNYDSELASNVSLEHKRSN